MPKTINSLDTSVGQVTVCTQMPNGQGQVLQSDANGNLLVGTGAGAALAAVSTVVLGSAAVVALTAGTALGPNNALIGAGSASVAKVGASGALGAAPVVIRPLQGFQWVTAGTGEAACYTKDDIGGAIIIPPGQLVCVEALVAAVSVVAAFTWAELPI